MRLGRQDHERGDRQHESGFRQREEPERPARYLPSLRVTEDQQIAEQRDRFPGDQKGHHIGRREHAKAGQQCQVEHAKINPGARTGLMVTRSVGGHRDGHQPKERGEYAAEACGLQLQRAGDHRAAGAGHRGVTPPQAGHPACYRRGPGQRRQQARNPQSQLSTAPGHCHDRRPAPASRGQVEPGQRAHPDSFPEALSRAKLSSGTFSASRSTATSSPCSSASGLGGQPGIHTSTGKIRSTAPWVNASAG